MVDEDAALRKQQLFDSLYALDDPSDDEPDLGLASSMQALSGASVPKKHVDPTERSQKLTRTVSAPTRLLAEMHDDGNDGIIHHRQAFVNDIAPTRLPRHQSTSSTGLQQLVPSSSTVPQATGKRKRNEPTIPDERQIFKGLHFFFFPNNDRHLGRRYRISKAIQYGAAWHAEWNINITHIIVDRGLAYRDVSVFLKVDSLPTSITLVDEKYPAECISARSLLDPRPQRFQVKGGNVTSISETNAALPTAQVPEASTVPVRPIASSPESLELKAAGKAVMTREPHTPSTVEDVPEHINEAMAPTGLQGGSTLDPRHLKCEDENTREFEAAISQAKQLQHAPLDIEDEDLSRPNSSDGSAAEEGVLKRSSATERPQQNWQDHFQCMHKNTKSGDENGPNAQTIAILQDMANYYAQVHDEWRPFAYRKAIATLMKLDYRVTTREEAISLPFVGERLASKIEEIAYTSRLRRLDNARLESADQTLQSFLQIYGVGFLQASKWVSRGFRTLDELLAKVDLSDNQRIGIAHHTDFNTPIPRAEVEAHASVVRDAALALDADFKIYTMGSYRRGAAQSGDIDLIITHPTLPLPSIRAKVLSSMIPTLFAQRFLRTALATCSPTDGTKWHGASCLSSSNTWRRIDLLLVPAHELGAALIYFTGNDIFNRSLRLLASRKGMRLNQRGLYRDVARGKGRVNLAEGTLVEGRSERGIFRALGVPWREAWERIC